MKNQNFGIEIELTGISRETAADTIAKYFGTTARYVGGAYKTWEITDTRDGFGKVWKVVRDSSISPSGTRSNDADEYRVEIVSPILGYSEIEKLQEIVREIRRAGGKVNDSCGIHVHVGAENHTANSLRNMMTMMYAREDIIFKALQVESFRQYSYCKKTSLTTLENARKTKNLTMDSLRDIWYEQKDSWHCANNHYHNSRYHALNLHATFSKGTVEFRMFNSTLHAGEVKAYINLALAMSDACVKAKSIVMKKTDEAETKIFGEWLKRIGLAGEEFKNTRGHLLKHLSAGNTATA